MKPLERSIKHYRIFIVISGLILASLACQVDIGGPEQPGEWIIADEAQATEVAQTWSQALSDAVSDGQVIVIFNEAQMTGFVAQRFQSNDDPLIQDPQIYLRQGQIQVYGTIERGIIKSTILVRVAPSIDPEGQLLLDLVEVSVGPVPAPELLTESLSAILTEALTGTIGSLATGIKISSLAISAGEMSIVGEIR